MAATVSNPTASNAALDALQSEQEQASAELQALDETRRQLETASEPDQMLDTDAKHEPEGSLGYEMTQTRRIGSIVLTVDGNSIRVGKPSGRAGMEMLDTFDEMEQSGKSLRDQVEYAWATLEEWSLDEEYDVDHWSNTVGTMDAIQLCRNIALGGNDPRR
ncbi:hypothetical protein [Natrinema pallidum]|uniref:Uncharacterized protein n=1 Tax=Natrinema pallidum TaxID=69527 RepID=A0A4P9TFH6_9EURY|nr:hypothetical protein [Natrinema pallidum]QCW03571.1 hypothetical protein FGF80_10105 [Natrinema pallidum]